MLEEENGQNALETEQNQNSLEASGTEQNRNIPKDTGIEKNQDDSGAINMETDSETQKTEKGQDEILSWYANNGVEGDPMVPERTELVSSSNSADVAGNHQIDQNGTDIWKKAAKRERRKKKILFWSVLTVFILVIAGIVLTLVVQHNRNADIPTEDEDGDSASSITDIFDETGTTIERYQGETDAWLTVNTEHGEALTPQEVYAKVNPSVVTVYANESVGAKVGTGIIMTEDGFILTNAHVISGGQSCGIILYTGDVYEAQLVGYDVQEDIAVLKAVDAANLPAAEFGDSDDIAVGDTVYAIGNPLGLELRGTFTDGIISAVERTLSVDGTDMTVIQTNAALNNGNSGGPLINEYGQIIGINTLKMSNTAENEATVEGLGFALPISTTSFVVNDILKTGEFHGRPMLGVSVVTVDNGDGTTHVEIYSVEDGYGAQIAGIQEGDIVLKVDGVNVSTTLELLAVRRSHLAGESMTITVMRDGKTMDFTVELMTESQVQQNAVG